MWNNICSAFDGETTNFGPRIEQLGDSQLYETRTLFTIGAGDDNIPEIPNVQALSTGDHYVIAIDNVVNVLCHQVPVFCNAFGSIIDCIALRSDIHSGVLLVGERCGNIHLVLIKSAKAVFTIPVFKTEACNMRERAIQSIDIYKLKDNDYRVCAVAGHKLIIASINEQILSQFAAATVVDLALLRMVVVDLSSKPNLGDLTKPVAFMVCPIEDQFLVCGEHGDLYSVQPSNEPGHRLLTEMPGYARKLLVLLSHCSLLVLNAEKQIVTFCLKTFVITDIWRGKEVVDFVLTGGDSLEVRSVESCKMAVLSVLGSETTRKLEIFSYPSRELLYMLRVNEFCYLTAMGHGQEDFSIVEGVPDGDQGDIIELRIRIVSEVLPETQLAKLIGKRQFSEAEEFAKLFHLSVEEVHWNHLLFLLDQLSCHQTPLEEVTEEKLVDEVCILVAKLPDPVRVARCCIETMIASPHAATRLLQFLLRHMSTVDCVEQPKYLDICGQIMSLLNKTVTFQLLHGSLERDTWSSFSKADLVEEICRHFRNDNIPSAIVIWERHQDELLAHIDCSTILCILDAIPGMMEVSSLAEWLGTSLLPCILQQVPEAMESVCMWVVNRASQMEVNARSLWPSGALQLLEAVPRAYELVSSSSGTLSLDAWLAVHSVPRHIRDGEHGLHRLYRLLLDVRDLKCLWSKYKCFVTLQELQSPDGECAVFAILDNAVYKNDVVILLKEFLPSYMKRKQLNASKLLGNYVEHVLLHSETSAMQEAPWEEKVIALTQFIDHSSHWVRAVVKILSYSPVPWSCGIEELANEGLLLKGSAAQEIETERKRMHAKIILHKYDMMFVRTVQLTSSEILVRKILLSEKPEAFKDALTVANNMGSMSELEICLFHLQRLLLRGDVDKFADALQCIPENVVVNLGPRIAMFGKLYISQHRVPSHINTEHFLECWQYLINVLTHNPQNEARGYSEILDQVRQVVILQRDYDICIPISKLESASGRLEVLKHGFEKLAATGSDKDGNDRAGGICKKMLHLACSLKFDAQSAIEALLCMALDSKSDLISALCGCLLKLPRLRYSVLDVLQDVLCKSEVAYNTVLQIHRLACQMCLTVEGNLLEKAITVSVSAWLLVRAMDLCNSMGALPFVLSDPCSAWRLSRIFDGQGLALSKDMVCSQVRNLVTTLNKLPADGKLESFGTVSETLQQLCSYLCQRLQGELCLSFVGLVTLVLNRCQHEEMAGNIFQDLLTVNLSSINAILIQATEQKHLDFIYIKGLFSSIPTSKALISIKNLVLQHHGNFKLLKMLAIIACEITSGEQQIQFGMLYAGSYWGHELAKSSISFKDTMIKQDSITLQGTLDEMVACASVNAKEIVSYSRHFNLNGKQALTQRLRFLLCTRAEEVFLESSSLSKTLKDAMEVLEALPKPYALRALGQVLTRVNPYCYEVLRFGYEYLDSHANSKQGVCEVQRELDMLSFLASYKRYGPPSESEKDAWYEVHPSVDLPPAAQVRLPFHYLLQNSPWKYINDEIYPDTVGAWLSVADTLTLDEDDIRFMAVENAVVFWSSQKHRGNVLDIDFLFTIKTHLSEISNITKAIACMMMVLKKLPRGPTAVRAAKICASLPASRLGSSAKESKERMSKFSKIYIRLKNEQILKENGIDSPSCLALCSKTERLIQKLLENTVWHSLFSHTDNIYNCIQEIAEEDIPIPVSLDVIKQKVQQWLQCSAPDSVTDETLATLDIQSCIRDPEESPRVIGTIHLMQHVPKMLEGLLKDIISAGKNELALQEVALALKCLYAGFGSFKETGSTEFSSVALASLDELKVLSYKAKLQMLGALFQPSDVNKETGKQLVAGLLTCHSNSPEMLKLVSVICLEFNVQAPSVWELLLSNATRLRAMDVLSHALPAMGRCPSLWNTPSFQSAWKCMLSAQLHSHHPVNEIEGFRARLALRCPCVDYLPLDLQLDSHQDKERVLFVFVCWLLRNRGKVAHSTQRLLNSSLGVLTILQSYKDRFPFLRLQQVESAFEGLQI